MKKAINKTFLASCILCAAGQASAAAFQLAEISTSGLGRSYAGEAAIADNAAVIATNPALMSQFKTNQFSAGGIYVDSQIRMNGTVSANLAGQTVAQAPASKTSVVPGSLIPNMYFVSPLNDKFAVGAGMNVNFGLKSEYEDDYAAGVFGGKTELTALNLNLSGSYRVTEKLSAGVGLNALYAKAEVSRNAGILADAVGNVVSNPQALSAIVAQRPDLASKMGSLSGLASGLQRDTLLTHLQDKTAWAFGYNLGLAYDLNERNRFGIAYHSKIDIDFKDRNAVSYLPYGTTPYIGEGGLVLHLPSYWEFSGYHKLTDKFAMHYSYKYTEWSRLKNLHATYADRSLRNDGLAFHKDEEYKDNSRIALGATYEVDEKLTLRAGVAYDESAAPRTHASASIPDTNRTWYSLGATYKFTPALSVDFGFAHLRGRKLDFSEEQSLAGGLVTVKADYKSKATANLYGLNINYSF